MGFKPKKGDAPPTGKVRPSSNFERTMALASQIAAESVPDEHTVDANERAPAVVAPGVMTPPAAPATPVAPAVVELPGPATPVAQVGPRGTAPTGAQLSTLPIDAIRQSPFQPRGRPSQEAVAAVGQAIARTGGIEALAGIEGHTTFQALSAEAKRLAELAYSISRDGVRDPIEVRSAEDGSVEALSGHRRLAAARLLGLHDVPVLDRGPMSSLQAAATVLSGNLHREDFTPWQEAVLVTEVIAQRRADALPADVRTVGAIMGYSHGRVSTLQTIRRVLSPALLSKVGELGPVEEALARYANYSRLEEVARMADDAKRESALRRLLGFADPAGRPVEAPIARTFEHRPKRRGGFTLEVHRAIEEFSPADAATLRELLAGQVARLDARLRALGKG